MKRKSVYLAIFNVLCIISLFLVNLDISEREAYAMSLGYVFSNSYLPLIKFQYLEGQTTLKSPPTLDWVQTLLLLLVFVDIYYLVRYLGSLRNEAFKIKNGS